MKTTRLSIFPSLPIFLTSLTLLFATAAQAQVPSYVPTNGLVGYWPFNGNANDESGNGNNGTVNGATLAADRFGNANSAYSFDGVGNYIGNSSNNLPSSTRSISVWFFANNLDGGPAILGYGGSTCGTSFFIAINQPPLPNQIINQGHCLADNLTSTYTVSPINDWYHLVITSDNNGTTHYLNGNLISSNSIFISNTYTLNKDFAIGTNVNPNGIMPYVDGNQTWWNGSLDDIGIWNRALTADEVLALYNGCNVTALEVSGNVTPTQFTQETYTYPNTAGSTYNWTVTNGVIVSGQGTDSIDVMWANTGIGSVSVVETNASNCTGDVVTYDVVVIPTNVEELSNSMILYPNPATTELNLQITSDLIGTDLFVFDALGKQILKQQILSTNTIINTSSFAAGNYVVKVGVGVKKFEVVR